MMVGYYWELIWWEDYIIRRCNNKRLYHEEIIWLEDYIIKKLYGEEII